MATAIVRPSVLRKGTELSDELLDRLAFRKLRIEPDRSYWFVAHPDIYEPYPHPTRLERRSIAEDLRIIERGRATPAIVTPELLIAHSGVLRLLGGGLLDMSEQGEGPTLERVLRDLAMALAALESAGHASFELTADYYWFVGDDAIVDERPVPEDSLNLASLYDDWEWVQRFTERGPEDRDWIWMAGLLRFLGERLRE